MTMPYSERRIYLPPTAGSPPLAMASDRDEMVFTADPALAPFRQDLTWYEGRELRRLSLAETESFIPIVEERLKLNGKLLAEYAHQLDVVERAINAQEAEVNRAYGSVRRLMLDDDARLGGPPSGVIMTHAITIGPDVWVASRDCYLRDTREWKQLEAVKQRNGADDTTHRRQRTELQRKLAEERIMAGTLGSRLYHLREHVAWWHRQFEELA